MILTLILTSLKIETSCLQNTFILGALMSRDTTVEDSALYNPRLGRWCSVVVKGLELKG